MALVKFINGENKFKAGLVRAINYITDENKTEMINIMDEKEDHFIELLLDLNEGERVINYITKEGKSCSDLITGFNCDPESAFDEMMITKQLYNKTDGRQFIHFAHSYSNKEDLDPHVAHEISVKLLEHDKFKGFQILVATHIDKKHLHTHYLINTVHPDTSLMWQLSRSELKNIKEYSNKLCHEYDLKYSFVELNRNKARNNVNKSNGELQAEKEGRSYKYETYLAVKECRKISLSKEKFILNMNELGYGVRWEDSRKDITFTTPSGRKINNDKRYPANNFTKEGLIKQFELNKQFHELNKNKLMKEEEYLKTQQANERVELVLQTAKMLSVHPELGNKDYPLTYLDGQALKEKMLQKAKGKGLDWEHER